MGEIACPMLAFHGTADQAIDISRAEAIAAAAPDHRGIIPIEGAAHAPNMTHPDQVNHALAKFLAALP
jgi:pimeloyl-ACP methyl ester carboxylesterase